MKQAVLTVIRTQYGKGRGSSPPEYISGGENSSNTDEDEQTSSITYRYTILKHLCCKIIYSCYITSIFMISWSVALLLCRRLSPPPTLVLYVTLNTCLLQFDHITVCWISFSRQTLIFISVNFICYLSIRRGIKQTVITIGAYRLCQLRTKFVQHPALKVNSICRGRYWGSSMWIPMQQVDYWSYILHSSNTWEKNENTLKQCISSL